MKNRLLLLLLVLSVIVTPLFSCNLVQESSATTATEETTLISPVQTEDPTDYETLYKNMSGEEFYQNYTPAKSFKDAYWRSKYGFMSGSLNVPDQAPTRSQNRPMQDGKYIRNSATPFIDENVYVHKHVLSGDRNEVTETAINYALFFASLVLLISNACSCSATAGIFSRKSPSGKVTLPASVISFFSSSTERTTNSKCSPCFL